MWQLLPTAPLLPSPISIQQERLPSFLAVLALFNPFGVSLLFSLHWILFIASRIYHHHIHQKKKEKKNTKDVILKLIRRVRPIKFICLVMFWGLAPRQYARCSLHIYNPGLFISQHSGALTVGRQKVLWWWRRAGTLPPAWRRERISSRGQW